MTVWGLVPARGGSKSIPLKNLASLAGRPLLDYVVRAGQKSGALARMICSTDHDAIAAHARDLGAEVDRRPLHLTGDDVNIDDVAKDLLVRMQNASHRLPESIVLLQPTSPFLQPEQVTELVELLDACPNARSVHNLYRVPHNLHAWNQRSIAGDRAVQFTFKAERMRARNKQEKPKLFAFGNLIAARSEALLAGDGFYAEPAHALTIASVLALDVDHPEDFPVAEALIAAGLVRLDHLHE